MKALFGTDGIRGEAGQFPLDPRTVSAIGFSLASHLAEAVDAPEIIIGRDTRESGESIERALIEGATRAGAKCLSAGVITTPGVAYLTRALQAAAGVVISASHNPYLDNGIKIFAPSGQKMDDSVERLIEADIFANTEQPTLSATSRGSVSPQLEKILQQEYLNFLALKIGKGLTLDDLTIVIDCANGASS
jgi:phosphoglucosamine mutase